VKATLKSMNSLSTSLMFVQSKGRVYRGLYLYGQFTCFQPKYFGRIEGRLADQNVGRHVGMEDSLTNMLGGT
jgi:hypothetical protein